MTQNEQPQYRVTRYTGKIPDGLRVQDAQTQEVLLDVAMGPGGPLHPRAGEQYEPRPWFFTGSPYGAEILALAKVREQNHDQ